jgi:hypothetical protein
VKPRTSVAVGTGTTSNLLSGNAYYHPFMNDVNISQYLDFQSGATASDNPKQWASWALNLVTPGVYNLKMTTKSTDSGQAQLSLVDMATNAVVKTFTAVWYPINATMTENSYGTIDLSDVSAGRYMLKLSSPSAWDTFLKVEKVTLTKVPAYYRSIASGNWSTAATWETSTDNINWATAVIPPLVNADIIDIQSNHTISLDDNASISALTLQARATLTVNVGKTLTANSILLNSDASGTATFIDNGTATFTAATVQQYLPQGRNWYISSPIKVGTAAALNTGTEVRTYNEASKSWDIVTDNLIQGKGYISVSNSGSGTSNVSFTGTLNTGGIIVPLTRTGITKPGFNLVGNPYPSYLNWSLVSTANPDVSTTMWFRTKTSGGAYTFSIYNASGNVAVTNGATTTITKYIPPMQAFWVLVNADKTSTDFTMTNAMRSHADVSGNTMKSPMQNNQQLFRLTVSNGTNSDEAVVYFNENAADGFDKYDSQKMSNGVTSVPEIYTISDNQQLVINGLGKITENMELPLGFTTGVSGDFKLKVTEITNFGVTTKVYLIDKMTNVETELVPEMEYAFSSAVVSNNESRFSLQFRAPGVATEARTSLNDNIFVSVNAQNKLVIFAPEKATYSVFNTLGQKVSEGLTLSNRTIVNNINETGMYVVKVSENGQNHTSRVIVKL